MLLKTLGVVESPFMDKFGTPRQSQIALNTISTLRFDKKKIANEMLDGLEVGAFIWIVFGFHLNSSKKYCQSSPASPARKNYGGFGNSFPAPAQSVGTFHGAHRIHWFRIY